uniref:RING-type domain-containing protein n=1 Tax=Mycena chlorophos TaxID=658473 RepID=A0ABQ0LIX8_MYCCL|nr:predicted protein [Mycena chlorophos]
MNKTGRNRPRPIRTGTLELKRKDAEAEYTRFALDLGAESPGASGSASPPPPSPLFLRRRRPSFTVNRLGSGSGTRLALRRPKPKREPSGDCGICFEQAVNPTRTSCCQHLFCADHIAEWLHGPSADGRCPACRERSVTPTPMGSPPRVGSPVPQSQETTSATVNIELEGKKEVSVPTSAASAQVPAATESVGNAAAVRTAGCLLLLALLAGIGRWVL